VRHLTEDQDLGSIPLTQKRKKAKHGDANTPAKAKDVLSPKQWHLRALILKSLYQCFLYDITDLKFLDATNFQASLLYLYEYDLSRIVFIYGEMNTGCNLVAI